MHEILDIFLEKSKQHHSNIIYAQIYKNDVLKEEFRLFPVKTRLNIWSVSKRTFSVVNMCNNAKISNMFHFPFISNLFWA